MRRIQLAPIAPALLIPISLLTGLPIWCAITMVCVNTSLAVLHGVVTEIIRWRASAQIATSYHAIRVLEIEDLDTDATNRPQAAHINANAGKASVYG